MSPVDVAAVIETLRALAGQLRLHPLQTEAASTIAGTIQDQVVPDGVDNPYWEIVRWLPCDVTDDFGDMDDRLTPATFVNQRDHSVELTRDVLVRTFGWAIPSPGDIAWIREILAGRGVVEIGAGLGYWAWQLTQSGIDVIAYEPSQPGVNSYVADLAPYFPVRQGDEAAAGRHPDRALLLCWPSRNDPWAANALAAYRGDLLIYVGEDAGGMCASQEFFEQLDNQWDCLGYSPRHATFAGIKCWLSAHRRLPVT